MDAPVTKGCFKCGETKPLSDFYKHPKMLDGHVNKCKECNKDDNRKNRADKVDFYREYDRSRGNRKTPEDYNQWKIDNPKKRAAHVWVGNALRDGRLLRQPCEVCGSTDNIHGHHDDYDKPKEVRWLCAAHHSQWHVHNTPLNGD